MNLPKIFIASSSKARDEIDIVCNVLSQAGADPIPWNAQGALRVGHYIWDALWEQTFEVDGAVFIFRPDDKLYTTNTKRSQVRPNVLLEFGLFSAILGRERCPICRFRTRTLLPSDLAGLNIIDFPGPQSYRAGNQKLATWAASLPSKQVKTPEDYEIKAIVMGLKAHGVTLSRIGTILSPLGIHRDWIQEYYLDAPNNALGPG